MSDETITTALLDDSATGDQRVAVAAHTPGPWHVGEVTMIDRDTSQERPDPHSAWVHNDGSFEASLISADALADARLIAAAPDMLAALKLNFAMVREGHVPDAELRAAFYATQSAIAKAEGRS